MQSRPPVGPSRAPSRAFPRRRLPLAALLLAASGVACGGSSAGPAGPEPCPATNARQLSLDEAYTTTFTVSGGVVRITGTGSGTLLGSSSLTADETPQTSSVPNHLVGRFSLAVGGDTIRGNYDVISTPPQPADNITFSGPFTISGGAGRFRCASGGGTMSGSADLPGRSGENVFVGTVATP